MYVGSDMAGVIESRLYQREAHLKGHGVTAGGLFHSSGDLSVQVS